MGNKTNTLPKKKFHCTITMQYSLVCAYVNIIKIWLNICQEKIACLQMCFVIILFRKKLLLKCYSTMKANID